MTEEHSLYQYRAWVKTWIWTVFTVCWSMYLWSWESDENYHSNIAIDHLYGTHGLQPGWCDFIYPVSTYFSFPLFSQLYLFLGHKYLSQSTATRECKLRIDMVN